MANSGINKAQVMKARNALIAKGMNPSIDAVRIELGNTGSKATIHRYLKEINDAAGSSLQGRVGLSDALTEIVGKLALQLQEEAQDVVEQSIAAHQLEVKRLKDDAAERQQNLSSMEQQLNALAQSYAESERSNTLITASERQLTVKLERQAQQLISQQDLIVQKNAHIASLEDKHQHTREALEHYRNSVKDQREQEQRRHEHQVQQLQAEIRQLSQTISLKQTDITQLNKDNSRLSTEISEVRKQLRSGEYSYQQLTLQQKINEDAVGTLTAQLAEAVRIRLAETQEITHLKQQLAELNDTSQSMHVELITAKTELTVKNQLFESLHLRAQ